MVKSNKLVNAVLAIGAGLGFMAKDAGQNSAKAADLNGGKNDPCYNMKHDAAWAMYYRAHRPEIVEQCEPQPMGGSLKDGPIYVERRMSFVGFFADGGFGQVKKGHETFNTFNAHVGVEREITNRLSFVGRAGFTTSLSNASGEKHIDYSGEYEGYRHDIKESRDYNSVDGQVGLKAKLVKHGAFSLDGYALGGVKHRWQTVKEDISLKYNGEEVDKMSRTTKVGGNALTGTVGVQANWEVDDRTQLSAYGEVYGDKAIGKGDNATGWAVGARATHTFDCIPFLCGDTGKGR